ncbi:MAG: NAD-dependent malic enzyme [Acidimicrobiales bacterium]
MATPTVSYSVVVRVELSHRPGTLGRLTTAIGEIGGNILGLDIIEVSGDVIVRDVTVLAADANHAAAIRNAAESVDGVHVRSVMDRTFRLHLGGKIEVRGRHPILSRDDLSMAYTPGVARVATEIAERPVQAHRYSIKANSVAVVSNGSAVLGLGNIGPYGAIPVMEGKAQLFKEFADIDAFPICLRTASVQETVETVERLEPVFGGINLEDFAAPDCFEIEDALKASLDIPVFHDDQHGTAVVVLAALGNSLKVVDKRMSDISVVIAGAGAAGVAIAKILFNAGVTNIMVADRRGLIFDGREEFSGAKAWLAEHTNPEKRMGSVGEALAGSDVFVGVSGPGLIVRSDVEAMAKNPIVFGLANPTPEIMPEEIEGIAAVIATGRSDYPNQINNVLCFPGIFRGALDVGAMSISESMKLAAAHAIANAVGDDELSPSYVVPSVFNRSVVAAVAAEVGEVARRDELLRHIVGL